jgi:hypothetical protein
MSQVSDVSIANQGFSAFRTELNNILGALNTMHSGTSRPASAAVGTMWLDTTNSGSNSLDIKFFDGAQDISVATINTSANTINFIDSAVTVADDSITLAKMASGTDGNLISYDASGNPVAVATGNDGQVLTSTGAGSPPVFETLAASVAFLNANTTTGNVRINDKTGDQSAGNPQYTFSSNTGTGMRRAASNIIAFDTNGNEAKRIDAAGQVTKPLQAYFYAVPASEQTNIANGNTIVFGTEIKDVGGNFASNTFTAPVTGVYAINVRINVNGYPANADYVWINIVTSNRTHKVQIQGNGLDNSSYYSLGGLAIADMDASDTVHITWEQSGASAEADVLGSNTHFYGYLLG